MMFEFLIETVEHRADHVAITGLVNAGVVRLRSIFSQTTLPQTASESCEINLTVSKIITYRRDVDELPLGMTGELHLRGIGADLLVNGAILRGVS